MQQQHPLENDSQSSANAADALQIFIERTDFDLLLRVLLKIVKTSLIIDNGLPVSDHANITVLRIDPTTFLERVLAATQTGNKAFASQNGLFRNSGTGRPVSAKKVG